jgi:hypothetical protein
MRASFEKQATAADCTRISARAEKRAAFSGLSRKTDGQRQQRIFQKAGA